MFFAVIGDIMSNFGGMQAVFAALEEEGIHRVVQTGNLGSDMPGAVSVLQYLRTRNVIHVAGILDRKSVKSVRGPHFSANHARSVSWPAADLEYLARLPRLRAFTEEGLRICVCHGTLNSSRDRLAADTSPAKFQRQRELAHADIVVCGGAEEPFQRMEEDVLFVSAGHMSPQLGIARFTVVQTEVRPWSASLCEVNYEVADAG